MTQNLPALTNEQRRLANIVRALKELQGALFRLTGASTFCAKAELNDFSNHLKEMARAVKVMETHLKNIYKNSIVPYDVIKMYADLETVIEQCYSQKQT